MQRGVLPPVHSIASWQCTPPAALPPLPRPAVHDEGGRQVFRWNPGETVTAVAYDNPIPGFGTNNTINLRLWAAKPDREFDLQAFNTGDYVQVGVGGRQMHAWWVQCGGCTRPAGAHTACRRASRCQAGIAAEVPGGDRC